MTSVITIKPSPEGWTLSIDGVPHEDFSSQFKAFVSFTKHHTDSERCGEYLDLYNARVRTVKQLEAKLLRTDRNSIRWHEIDQTIMSINAEKRRWRREFKASVEYELSHQPMNYVVQLETVVGKRWVSCCPDCIGNYGFTAKEATNRTDHPCDYCSK